MASIENRSRTQVTVRNRDDLTRFFAHDKTSQAEAYLRQLREAGHKPSARVLDETFLVRYRVHGERRSFTAASAVEAVAIKQRIESEQHHGLFVDYSEAHRTSFADILSRYMKEEAPRHKGFLVTAYQINGWLADAGLERLDIAAVHAAHKNPQQPDLRIPKPIGRRMSEPSSAVGFIRKSFAALEPEDFREYMDERLQVAEPATVDRELDVFRAACRMATKSWRIHVHIDPMSGLERPKYFNERDRRLRGDEEARLLAAARAEDARWSVTALADETAARNKYQRLKALRKAREAEDRPHVPIFETFIQFQLMTGARRSETLKLTWRDVRLEDQSAFLAETKNGRSRTLPLRSDLVALLQLLPRTSELVFPVAPECLRKAWTRICKAADLPTDGQDRLRIHDLRHEAISRVAEAGSRTPGGFSLLDLQAFSGHRDPRMLMRYAHLTPSGLAKRLDAAFQNEGMHTSHHGRIRLTKQAGVSLAEVMSAPLVGKAGSPSPEGKRAAEPSVRRKAESATRGAVASQRSTSHPTPSRRPWRLTARTANASRSGLERITALSVKETK